MAQSAPAGWYPDSENPAQQRYWDGTVWTQAVAPISPAEVTPHDLAHEVRVDQSAEAPFLSTWKTSVGFSILGLISGPVAFLIIWMIVGFFIGLAGDLLALDRQLVYPLVAFFTAAIVCTVCIVYAAVFYPSYFRKQPLLRSSKLASFFNFACGGPLFGALWNRGLTNRVKGVSHVVWIVLLAVWLLGVGLNVADAYLFGRYLPPASFR